MIALALLIQAASLGANNFAVDEAMVAPRARPSFADEFAVPKVDTSKWRFDTHRNATGWYNNEKQYYSADRRENARVDRGALVIEARKEVLSKARFADWGGQAYSSVKLVTRAMYGYGFYEIRAQLPCGRGMWPAIWMVPNAGTWPNEGEIDIMEMVGWDPNVVLATLHTGDFNHAKGTQRGSKVTIPTACTGFHRYQLDWRPGSITIGYDDRAYMRVRDDQPGGRMAWPFDRPMPLILNLAVGGDWGGQKGIDDTALPQTMRVDYVRYWKRER